MACVAVVGRVSAASDYVRVGVAADTLAPVSGGRGRGSLQRNNLIPLIANQINRVKARELSRQGTGNQLTPVKGLDA